MCFVFARVRVCVCQFPLPWGARGHCVSGVSTRGCFDPPLPVMAILLK